MNRFLELAISLRSEVRWEGLADPVQVVRHAAVLPVTHLDWRELPPDEREDLLLEAFEISQAVIHTKPELAVHQAFVDRIASAIRAS